MHNFNSVRHYLRQVRQQKVNYKVKRQVRILMKTLKNGCRYISYLIREQMFMLYLYHYQ